MPRKGPPKKPTRLELLQGKPGKRPVNEQEPQPRVGTIEPPDWLTPEAREEWDRIVPELERLKLLTQIDSAMLIGYCTQWGVYVKASRQLARQGLTFKSKNKQGASYQGIRPQFSIAQRALEQCRMLAAEFGLTPAARTKLKVEASEKPKNVFNRFVGGKGA